MTDTTNISDLPTGENITLETKEMPPQQIQQPRTPGMPAQKIPPMPTLSQSTLNQIVSGIQTASETNMTQLPSRDIPMPTHNHTQDPQIKPNYIPPPTKEDYIQDHDSLHSMVTMSQKKNVQQDRLDAIYEEAQTPIFVMILFLIFQLPAFQRMLRRYIPAIFSKDGGPNFSGYLFKTLLFGGSFYLVQKGTKYLSQL